MHTQADIGRCVQTAICVVYEDVHASLTRNRNHAYSNAGPCTQCSAYHTTDGDGKTNACSCYDVATGAINASGIVALFGHGRCPGGGGGGGTPPHFEACSFAPACLGAPNPALEGKYKANDDDDGGKDPATRFRNETCATGYRPHSFLCGACAKGYSFSDLDGDCDRCPDEAANVAVVLRCRPMLPHEVTKGIKSVVRCDTRSHEVHVSGKAHNFKFSRVYDQKTPQRQGE